MSSVSVEDRRIGSERKSDVDQFVAEYPIRPDVCILQTWILTVEVVILTRMTENTSVTTFPVGAVIRLHRPPVVDLTPIRKVFGII